MSEKMLTVVMADHGPVAAGGDSVPSYRTVHLTLTPKQIKAIEPRNQYERVSRAYIEDTP